MKRLRLLVVAALASSALVMAAPPAHARCLPEYAVVCQVYVIVCDLTDRPCAV